MDITLQGFLIAGLTLLTVLALTMLFRHYRAGASERRMRSMMRQLGLDPDADIIGDHEVIMQAIRRRCRKCQAVQECEVWLMGDGKAQNDFCPNARVFEILARHQPPAA